MPSDPRSSGVRKGATRAIVRGVSGAPETVPFAERATSIAFFASKVPSTR
jgi:hypothetical protein